MKKNLCWLLASAVLFTCLAAAVFAVGFTDSDSIGAPYREAVEQMTALGVLNGFPDGTFQPQGTLTREQGAKIIAYLCLGDAVDSLVCTEAPFTDVEVGRWSAPVIAWCAEREILLGYGDGTFGPEDKLTGDQFAKMLLCALRLGDPARYAGAGWDAAVRLDADALALYEGDGMMATDQPITREQAALLAWNAVKVVEKAAADQAASDKTAGNTTDTASASTVENTNGFTTPSLAWLHYLLSQLEDDSNQNTTTPPSVELTSSGDDITLPELP